MKTQNIKNIILLHVLLYGSFVASSQKDSTLNIKQVEVVKTFEAQLEEAQKVSWNPVMPAQKEFNPKYNYDISIVPMELTYPDPTIRPLAMDQDEPFIIKNGFVHLGYGLRNNPYVLGGYSLQRKDKFDAGVIVGYESLDNSNRLIHQKYRDLNIGLHGSYLLKENLKLYGTVRTDFRKRHFHNTEVIWDTLSPVRTLNAYDINVGISNPEMTKYKLNYDVNLTLRNMAITEGKGRDNGMKVNAFGEKIMGKSTVLRIEGMWDYHTFSTENKSQLTVASITPTLKTHLGPVIFLGGLDVLYGSDGSSALFPKIMISYGIAGQKLQVFADVQQDHYVNNFAQVSRWNPWLNTQIDSIVNTVFQEYSAGIRGRFSFLNYQAKGGYKNVKNQMFLLNNIDNLSLFDMSYDDMGIVFVSGNAEFFVTPTVSIGGSLTYNVLDPKTFEKAWHLPALESYLFGRVTLLEDKLLVSGDLYTGSAVHFIERAGETATSNALFDLNFGAEYSISDYFKVFGRAINVLNNRFERFYGNPSIGFNAMIGIKWVF